MMKRCLRNKIRLQMSLTAISIAVFACGGNGNEESAEEPFLWPSTSADTTWVEFDGVEFPAGMDRGYEGAVEAYVFAAKHPDVLHYMPCYCGCEQPATAHKSNYDCFINGIDRSGPVPRVSPNAMGFS